MACNKKTVSGITERKYEPSKRIVTTFPSPGTVSPDTIAGKVYLWPGVADVTDYQSRLYIQKKDGKELYLL